LILNLLNELGKFVGDALRLHEKNLASQSPGVLLSIGSDWPRHRETESNDEFPPLHVSLPQRPSLWDAEPSTSVVGL
jgi:hypothetical protein